jgi:hypothetical protein
MLLKEKGHAKETLDAELQAVSQAITAADEWLNQSKVMNLLDKLASVA